MWKRGYLEDDIFLQPVSDGQPGPPSAPWRACATCRGGQRAQALGERRQPPLPEQASGGRSDGTEECPWSDGGEVRGSRGSWEPRVCCAWPAVRCGTRNHLRRRTLTYQAPWAAGRLAGDSLAYARCGAAPQNEADRALAERYAPVILFDAREPFLPCAAGYDLSRPRRRPPRSGARSTWRSRVGAAPRGHRVRHLVGLGHWPPL